MQSNRDPVFHRLLWYFARNRDYSLARSEPSYSCGHLDGSDPIIFHPELWMMLLHRISVRGIQQIKYHTRVHVIKNMRILTPNSSLGSFWLFFRSSSVYLPHWMKVHECRQLYCEVSICLFYALRILLWSFLRCPWHVPSLVGPLNWKWHLHL